MKLQGIRRLCIITALFALLYACTKTDSAGSGSGHKAEFVKATLSGRVTDDRKLPVSGATVKVATTTATTDADGFFTIKDVYVDKNATLVKVEKAGYFLGTKTIMTGIDESNAVAIQLIKKEVAGAFTATSGGNITVPASGGTILFEANSIVNPADNKAYTGKVTVSAFFINPSASNFRDIMPGTLRGITMGNEETGLQSFGMMAVELNSESGEKLQIAVGKTASLRFPITEALRTQAPATIPLWSLDETTGLWKEEGVATREGDEYVGTVSHFSFWNCDAPFPIANFILTVKTQQGQALAEAEVVIVATTSDTTSVQGYGITNGEGKVTGALPVNKTLQLKIYDKCRNLVHTQNIGPFTTATDIGAITVNANPTLVTFKGSVMNCNSAAVANGHVLLELEGTYLNIPVTNGSFNKTITRCGNGTATATLTAFDADNNVSGPSIQIPVSGNTVNAGSLAACGISLDTYIKYNFNGTSYQLLPPTDSMYASYPSQSSSVTALFGVRGRKVEEEIVIMFSGKKEPGSYPVILSDVYLGNTLYSRNGSFNVNITEYAAAPGGYIAGTFSGSVKDSLTTVSLPLNVSFRVKR